MKIIRAFYLLPLLLLASCGITDPNGKQELVLGSSTFLVLPDTVHAGVPFDARLDYAIGTCDKLGYIDVSTSGAVTVLKSFDYVLTVGLCNAAARLVSKTARITLTTLGRAEIDVAARHSNSPFSQKPDFTVAFFVTVVP